jgi:hypothetical protein
MEEYKRRALETLPGWADLDYEGAQAGLKAMLEGKGKTKAL